MRCLRYGLYGIYCRAYSLENWRERAENLLARFELDDKKKKLGRELSKGMQQKLSICCGILPEPKVILFDETMVGLDPHAIKELKNMIIEQRQAGNAILLSTHMLDSVPDFWDSTNIMIEGKIVRQEKEVKWKKQKGSGRLFFKDNKEGELMNEALIYLMFTQMKNRILSLRKEPGILFHTV